MKPLQLSDDEKLKTLRQLDYFRNWQSLDDERFCLECQRVITGRGIRILGENREADSIRLACATEHCVSIPMDWILPSNEVLSFLSQ